ncbi:MAG TPA: hypothetical protein VFP87_01810 [Chitinophagaceae bacterium]|nr:hypothetical protein [Chitinophagaceae bacterium]
MTTAKRKDNKTEELREAAKTEDEMSGNNSLPERFEVDQTRVENRREADLEDKTPAGDAGVEDNKDEGQAKDPIGESNY